MSAYGYVNDRDTSLQSSGGPAMGFGLNTGHIAKMAYVTATSSGGRAYEGVEITASINGREAKRTIFPVDRVYDRRGNVIADEQDPEYQRRFAAETLQNSALVQHVAKATGVTDEQIRRALATPPLSFQDWAERIIGLLPSGYASVPVDIFLEYQWSIREGQDRTWPEFPRNLKGGLVCVPAVAPVGAWKEERQWTGDVNGRAVPMEGLRYVDGAGNVHPFARTRDFMESNKGRPQGEVRARPAPPAPSAAPAATVAAAPVPDDVPW